jgi:hypothetical protein
VSICRTADSNLGKEIDGFGGLNPIFKEKSAISILTKSNQKSGELLHLAWIMNSLYNQALKQSNFLRKDLDAFEAEISSATSSTTASTSPTVSSSATALQGTLLLSQSLR